MLHTARARASLALTAFAAGMTLSLLPAGPAAAADLCVVGNVNAVVNGPTAPTVCTFATPVTITEIRTYHWNNQHGAAPGMVGLQGPTIGTMMFAAKGTPGQDNTPNANWIAATNVTIPAGSYTVVDSDRATWSQNGASQGRGFVNIVGTPPKPPPVTPSPAALSHFKCYTMEGAPPRGVVVLSDQFLREVRTTLGPPELFCTPVVKTMVIGEPINVPPGADHLTCYQIKPALSPNAQPLIINQLQSRRIGVLNTRLLCVPTVKRLIPKPG